MPERRIPEEQAQRIWRRAAELQAAAAERAEYRKRALVAGTESEQPDGLALTDVEAAAVEAGIGAEFVQEAIAELDGESQLQPEPTSWVSRIAARMLGRPPRVIETSRIIPASPETVYGVMQRLLPNPPFGLILRDTLGADLFEDGVFVFETDIVSARTSFEWQMEFGDVKRIHMTLRRVPGQANACEVTARAPLGRLGLNLALSGGFTAAGGGGGAAAGAAVAPGFINLLGITGALGTAAFAGVAAITGVAAGGIVLAGYRGLYRWGMGQGLKGLESVLQALAVDVRTQGAFAPRAARELPVAKPSRDPTNA
jgi:hypothetical protein